jgi:Xaa-Pro aminopeptidase
MKVYIFYSGYYDEDTYNDFIVDNDFFYKTCICEPNIFILRIEDDDNNIILNKKYSAIKNSFWKSNVYEDYRNILEYLKSNKDIKQIYINEFEDHKLYNLLKDKFTITKINYHKEREIKNIKEIKNIFRACLFTKKTLLNIPKFSNELEIYRYLKFNGQLTSNYTSLSYDPIVAIGLNGGILHYNKPKDINVKDGLLLIDYGLRYKNYCCDFTRVFPVNKKFTDLEKDIYNIVYYCFIKVKDKIKGENTSFLELTNYCYILLFYGLFKNNIILENNFKFFQIKEIVKYFFPHSLGHNVGLDVHDVPIQFDLLKINMIITIEPGIYFNNLLLEYLKKSEYNKYINWEKINLILKNNIGGVRIEDTILIIKDSYINFINLPTSINEIEEFMNK